MSGRSLAIAAQAVVVGALILVVYLTLLKPEGPDSLLGIDAPGAATSNFPEPGTYTEDGQTGSGSPEQPASGQSAGGGGGGEGISVTGSATALVPAGRAVAAGTATDASAGDAGSPADDQYGDTLARLSARLD
jgi:hypothetical protein